MRTNVFCRFWTEHWFWRWLASAGLIGIDHRSSAGVYGERKLVRSMVGKGTKILNANGLLPKGQRLVVGENTTVYL